MAPLEIIEFTDDLELGRPTEVDAVTGEIVLRAAANGVEVPVIARRG